MMSPVHALSLFHPNPREEGLSLVAWSCPAQRHIMSQRPKIRPRGFEPLTCGLEVRCSIQLSYGRPTKYPVYPIARDISEGGKMRLPGNTLATVPLSLRILLLHDGTP